jgi:hypothetical protein
MQDDDDESLASSSLSSYYLHYNDDDESSTGSLFIPPTENPITRTWIYCLRHINKQIQDFFRPSRANQVGSRGILGKSKDQEFHSNESKKISNGWKTEDVSVAGCTVSK